MEYNQKLFNTKPMVALASTGVASAAALLAGTIPAAAGDMYFGVSGGMAMGTNPAENDGDPDSYSLSGGNIGMFLGGYTELGNGLILGGELAFSNGINGDPDGNAGYDYSYDIEWTVDTKLRLGKMIGNTTVYGFAGMSFGVANNYWTGYTSNGINFGVGAEMPIGDKMFVGIEAIQRNLTVNIDSTSYTDTHNVVSLRAGFKF